MKKSTKLLCIFTLLLILQIYITQTSLTSPVLTPGPNATGEEDNKRSPYFFVEGDPTVDHFPLLKTAAEIDIAGVIAEVELTKVYKNEGEKTIEAIYVFPLGSKSAIHGMEMKIGKRVVRAKIEEREKAQKVYQNAIVVYRWKALPKVPSIY